MQNFMVIGNLTRDVEKVEGKELYKFNIAENEMFTDKDGNRPVQFFNVCVWNKLGENCMKFLKKGSKVAIEGRIQQNYYEKDGVKKLSVDVIASEVEFLGTPKAKPELTEVEDDGTLPF